MNSKNLIGKSKNTKIVGTRFSKILTIQIGTYLLL